MTRSRLLAVLLIIAVGAVGLFVLKRFVPGAGRGESNGSPEARAHLTAGDAARRSANLLIDGEGRIAFRPVVHDDATRQILERQVEALLNRGDTTL